MRASLPSDRDFPSQFDHRSAGRRIVAHVSGVTLQVSDTLDDSRQTLAVLAANHSLMADVVGDIVQFQAATSTFASRRSAGMSGRSMKPKRAVARHMCGARSSYFTRWP